MVERSPGGATARVEAPARIWMGGQFRSGCAPVAGCGAFADEPEKKFDIPHDEEDAGAAAAGAAATGGALCAPNPLPDEQPAERSANDSMAARPPWPHHRIRMIPGNPPPLIAK
jgi:hypothetical protein